jgi:hypothetical protein
MFVIRERLYAHPVQILRSVLYIFFAVGVHWQKPGFSSHIINVSETRQINKILYALNTLFINSDDF